MSDNEPVSATTRLGFDRRNLRLRRSLVALVAVLTTVMSTLVLTTPASAGSASWTAQSAAESNFWTSVTYGNGVFVAISYGGSNPVMTSPDGVTWTARTPASASGWISVTYGNGLFVAVTNRGTDQVMTSPDGVNWTAQTAAEQNTWWAVTYGNGLFVAVSGDGANRVMTSSDGVTWTARTAAAASGWNAVTYGNGLFVAVAYDGSTRVMTSGWPSLPPGAPASLVATPGNGSASISFTAGSNAGPAITKYQYKVGAGAWTDAVGTSSPITITGLTNYVTSSIRIRAVNSHGASPASAAVSVRPKVTGPSIGVAYSSGKNGAFVGFSFARPAGSILVGFTVRAYAKGTNTVVSSCQVLPNSRNCYVGSLVSGTEYDIRVQGYLRVSGSSTVRETFESATARVRINS